MSGNQNYNRVGNMSVFYVDGYEAAIFATMTDDDIVQVSEADGMDGRKYRNLAGKEILKGIVAVAGVKYTNLPDIAKRFFATCVTICIGMLLGVVANKDTLQRNIGTYMTDRSIKDDYLAIAYKVITEHFKTYVSEKSTKAFPSIKFPSCMPDFCLLGVTFLMSKMANSTTMYLKMQNDYSAWPELLKKQWMGNFKLNTNMQDEHEAWEKDLWDNKIKSTRNEANKKAFKVGFNSDIYTNTRNDDFLIRDSDGMVISPSLAGYAKDELRAICCYLVLRARAVELSHGDPTISDDFNAMPAELTVGSGKTITDVYQRIPALLTNDTKLMTSIQAEMASNADLASKAATSRLLSIQSAPAPTPVPTPSPKLPPDTTINPVTATATTTIPPTTMKKAPAIVYKTGAELVKWMKEQVEADRTASTNLDGMEILVSDMLELAVDNEIAYDSANHVFTKVTS
jgi:hypothetical protein